MSSSITNLYFVIYLNFLAHIAILAHKSETDISYRAVFPNGLLSFAHRYKQKNIFHLGKKSYVELRAAVHSNRINFLMVGDIILSMN